MYISVIYMCISHVQVCGLCVSFSKHTILVKILNLQDTGILAFHLFVCMCVLCVMCFFGFIPFIFFHLLCKTLFLPFFLWFAHFLWFDLGFCLNFWGWVVLFIYRYRYLHYGLIIIQTNVCAYGGIKQCVLVFACANGCMIEGEW